MIHTYIPNYLFSTTLDSINNNALMESCLKLEDELRVKYNHGWQEEETKLPYCSFERKIPFTTSLFKRYNIFTFPNLQISLLYSKIREVISPCLPDEPHMIAGWLNVYHNNEKLLPHTHWEPKFRSIHGFYCVNTENVESSTTYKVPEYSDVEIISKNGLLVFGKSDNDTHYTSTWTHDTPRITVAFDIVPITTLNENNNLKHKIFRFIPFKS